MIHQLGRNRAGTRVVIFVTGARVIPYRIVNRVVGCDISLQFSALGIHDQLSVGAAPAQSLHAPES